MKIINKWLEDVKKLHCYRRILHDFGAQLLNDDTKELILSQLLENNNYVILKATDCGYSNKEFLIELKIQEKTIDK